MQDRKIGKRFRSKCVKPGRTPLSIKPYIIKAIGLYKENQADQHELDELLRKKKKFALVSF